MGYGHGSSVGRTYLSLKSKLGLRGFLDIYRRLLNLKAAMSIRKGV
jgi:hypothetical protein